MDLHNNRVGRSRPVLLWAGGSWAGCYKKCEQQARKKSLWWFRDCKSKKNWNARAKKLIDSLPAQNPSKGWEYKVKGVAAAAPAAMLPKPPTLEESVERLRRELERESRL